MVETREGAGAAEAADVECNAAGKCICVSVCSPLRHRILS